MSNFDRGGSGRDYVLVLSDGRYVARLATALERFSGARLFTREEIDRSVIGASVTYIAPASVKVDGLTRWQAVGLWGAAVAAIALVVRAFARR